LTGLEDYISRFNRRSILFIMALIDSLVIFLVNLLIGGIAIYVGAKLVTGKKDLGYAIIQHSSGQ
jgi:hypothetical protein